MKRFVCIGLNLVCISFCLAGESFVTVAYLRSYEIDTNGKKREAERKISFKEGLTALEAVLEAGGISWPHRKLFLIRDGEEIEISLKNLPQNSDDRRLSPNDRLEVR